MATRAADQTNRDAYTSKSSGTANTVKVDLRICIPAIVVREILDSSQHEKAYFAYNVQALFEVLMHWTFRS